MLRFLLIGIRERIVRPQMMAKICAVFTLAVLPLACRNGFFDINRFKVELVLCIVPLISLLALAGWILHIRDRRTIAISGDGALIFAALTIFLLACLVSCAMQRFSIETLYGTEGRYSGLFFLLCCGAVFILISLSRIEGNRECTAAVMTASAVALLGILNGCGMDPLRFYAEIKREQIPTFVSTIGNIDFFGAYLSMVFPITAAKCVFTQRKRERTVFGFAAVVIICGIAASRSDSAYAALQLACIALIVLSGDHLPVLGRMNLLWSFSFTVLPIMRFGLERGRWNLAYSGMMALICDTGIIWIPAVGFLAAAYACFCGIGKGKCAPGKSRLCKLSIALLPGFLSALLAAIIYFTAIDQKTELGTAATILRFDDYWGSRRGFVYRRSIEAFSDFSFPEMLFGCGVDSTKRILTPYFDNESMLQYGTFNDAHCQPLQFLLTTGIIGAAAYLLLYVMTACTCFKAAKEDALLGGIAASLCAYSIIAMLGAAQPIVIITYFSIAALGVSRARYLKGRECHES